MGTAVVGGGDTVPILQSTEHIFNFVVPFVQIYTMGGLILRIFLSVPFLSL